MVDRIDAYRIINQSVLRVANDLIELDQVEFTDKTQQVRLEETVYSIADARSHLDGTVIVAHDLTQYKNKFYSITLKTSESVWIDYLVGHTIDEIDLTEFGEFMYETEGTDTKS